ncbi:MAG: MoxR family ATPase [Clostridia bacterium]|nr:MoxR family ATPase [Clostridia bacterium]
MNTEDKVNITEEELTKSSEIIRKIWTYYGNKIVGQKSLGLSLLISVIANGHILLESVPGLAKTTAAKVITDAVSGKFSRIQCTPDLLPSDIIGTQNFNYSTNSFETKLGPVYANFVLLDEINRSSAKTQSAMLEAMQEHQTSIGGTIYKMPEVFIVIATQNPIEQEGTYLLSEAQLDRFLLKENLDYPSPDEELEILNRVEQDAFSKNEPILDLKDVVYLQNLAKKVYIDDSIKKYIIEIINATRHAEKVISPELAKYINMGSSTRGAISFMECSKALALIRGRAYVIPEDIKSLSYNVLRHRIELNYAAVADEVKVETIIDSIMGAIKTP